MHSAADCPAADRPSVTDSARADEVYERLLWLLRRAGDEWGPLGVAKVAASLAGAEWAAGRAETATATTEDAVERVFQTTHPAPNTVMGWIRAGYEAGLLA